MVAKEKNVLLVKIVWINPNLEVQELKRKLAFCVHVEKKVN